MPDYLISRAAEHGRRRAAEMREVARTLEDVDVEPTMAMATAERQEWVVKAMGELGVSYSGQGFSWRELVDTLALAPLLHR